jgi:hypothetical protein
MRWWVVGLAGVGACCAAAALGAAVAMDGGHNVHLQHQHQQQQQQQQIGWVGGDV